MKSAHKIHTLAYTYTFFAQGVFGTGSWDDAQSGQESPLPRLKDRRGEKTRIRYGVLRTRSLDFTDHLARHREAARWGAESGPLACRPGRDGPPALSNW